MNILVTGAKGMVGTALVNNLKNIRDGLITNDDFREYIEELIKKYQALILFRENNEDNYLRK